MTIKVTNIQQSFLYLPSCEIINPIAAGETFWQDLAQGQLPALAKGRLFSTCSFAAPWAMWEFRPAGDELLLRLADAVELRLETQNVAQNVTLHHVSDYVLVPAGV